mmetsp:Transcript_12373/g.37888  ORF Transcript_12373/g.37888 Transcript_12373/m.37888 type:complete len:248 (+) Transcript_12373:2888-3631(+)
MPAGYIWRASSTVGIGNLTGRSFETSAFNSGSSCCFASVESDSPVETSRPLDAMASGENAEGEEPGASALDCADVADCCCCMSVDDSAFVDVSALEEVTDEAGCCSISAAGSGAGNSLSAGASDILTLAAGACCSGGGAGSGCTSKFHCPSTQSRAGLTSASVTEVTIPSASSLTLSGAADPGTGSSQRPRAQPSGVAASTMVPTTSREKKSAGVGGGVGRTAEREASKGWAAGSALRRRRRRLSEG